MDVVLYVLLYVEFTYQHNLEHPNRITGFDIGVTGIFYAQNRITFFSRVYASENANPVILLVLGVISVASFRYAIVS